MAKKFDLIVFDWDGTLMDSATAIVDSLKAACQDIGIKPPTEERARHIIGLGLDDALRVALPDLSSHRYSQLVARYRIHYLTRDHELTLFAGVLALIESLAAKGHHLAIATGKSRQGLERAFDRSGVRALFGASRCADECRSKPHPQMLDELMQSFTADPTKTLMIGDTTHDLQMARNAGVASLAVSYGAHPHANLVAEHPLYCAATVAELSHWLQANA